MQILKTLRLPVEEYVCSKTAKTGICIHHTVGGSAKSTFNWWVQNKARVATSYIIERNGDVYEVFDPDYWAYQFGLAAPDWNNDERIAMEKRFIGIELASEGGLIESDGNLYCFDKVSPKTYKSRGEALDFGSNYRGYRYYDKYELPQVDSLILLLHDLIGRYHIEKIVPADKLAFYGKKLKNFNGIIGHAMVRKDKSDPAPDMGLWKRVVLECGLNEFNLNDIPGIIAAKKLTWEDIEKLYNENIQEVNKLDTGSGSIIKQMLLELETNKTFIKLNNAVQNGHSVNYEFLEGNKDLVYAFGNYLGLIKITENKIEALNS